MKYRPFFWCAIAALAAVGLCVFLHNQIAWILTAAGITLAAVFLFLSIKPREKRGIAVISAVLILSCIGSFAYLYTTRYEYALDQVNSGCEIRACVTEPLKKSFFDEPRYLMQVRYIDRKEVEHPLEMEVTVSTKETYEIGDVLLFYTGIGRKHVYGDNDATVHMLGSGVFLKCYIFENSMAQVIGSAEDSFALTMSKNKQTLCRLADEHLSFDAAQILKGMLYGDKREMQEDMLLDFRYSGFAHLLAVSGLHIQVIFHLVSLLLSRLLFWCKYFPRRYISSIASLLLIWGFIFLIGCPVSALRSGIMVTVATVGTLITKRSDTLNSLGISVIVIQLVMPFSVCSLGFWLSVMATFGIGFFGTYFYHKLHWYSVDKLDEYRIKNKKLTEEMAAKDPQNAQTIRREMLKKRQRHSKKVMWICRILRAFIPGVAATMGLLPFYMFYFSYIPLGSLLFGALLGFLFEAVVLLGVLFSVSGLTAVSFGVEVSAFLLQPMLTLLDAAVTWVGRTAFLVIPLRQEFSVIFCLLTVICVIVCRKEVYKKLFGKTSRLRIGIFLAAFYVLGLLFTLYYQYNIVEVASVGDAGGKNVIVTAKNRATVFLCSNSRWADESLVAYLREKGIMDVDHIYIVETYHGMSGDAGFLKQQMRVKEISYNAYGLPGAHLMTPIKPGDHFLNEEILLTFDYDEKVLCATVRHGETRIGIMSEQYRADSAEPYHCDAVFLYAEGMERSDQNVDAACLLPLSRTMNPKGISFARMIDATDQTVTVEFDLNGELHLP